MYNNNFTEEPIVIGIDHGFSLIKTRNHIFSNGVSRCNGKPPVVENSLCYNGSYYCVGVERKTVVTDKTADEDFFLLTLAAVAKELKTRGLSHNAVVVLGAGVPFKRSGEEAGKLTAYFFRTGIHDFIFEEEEYSIAIEKVYCFPQCFAAVADRIANMEGRYVVADIGSWTKDIISIVDKRIDTEKSVTVPNSIITLFREINDGATESDVFRKGIRSLYREKTEPDKVVDWDNRIQECAMATADVMMERMRVMLDGISFRQNVMPSAQADSNSNNHENDCEGMKPPEASLLA